MSSHAICSSAHHVRSTHLQQIKLDEPERPIPTGSIGLNNALGIGGYPRGRLIEIYGRPDSGKTTLGLAAAHQTSKMGESIAYIDQDHKLSMHQILQARLSINSNTMFYRCSSAHAALRSALQLITSGQFSLVVIDTLGSMFPGMEVEHTRGEFESEMGSLFERALPRMSVLAANNGTCVLILNQVRQDETHILDKLTTPGGYALHHSCSVRIELRRKVAIKKDAKTIIGSLLHATVTKNCVATPYGETELAITHSFGLDSLYEALSLSQDRGTLRSNTSRYLEYRGNRLGANLIEAHEYLRVRPELTSMLLSDIASEMSQAVAV